MTPEQYAAQQAVISGTIVSYILNLGRLFLNPALGLTQWLQMLQLLYPEVAEQRLRASELAREFYDSQRSEHSPGRHDFLLEEYPFEWFVEAMEPSRKWMQTAEAPESGLGDLARRVVKEVENGGRRTMIHAVESDPSPVVQGWARVATGRETCGFCLMLVSRGPVYLSAENAGLDADDTTAQNMIANGEDLSELMREWHTGCDCKVVPVFDRRNWTGKAAADRALKLWNDASREAKRLVEADPNRGRTINEEAINALRRRIYRGDIDPQSWAGLNRAA